MTEKERKRGGGECHTNLNLNSKINAQSSIFIFALCAPRSVPYPHLTCLCAQCIHNPYTLLHKRGKERERVSGVKNDIKMPSLVLMPIANGSVTFLLLDRHLPEFMGVNHLNIVAPKWGNITQQHLLCVQQCPRAERVTRTQARKPRKKHQKWEIN